MFKIKNKSDKPKPTILYNVIEDYFEFNAPGNVTACAMTHQEDLSAHAKVLSESYEVPLETMTTLLTEGGDFVYPQIGGLLTRGLFACVIGPTGGVPKQTFVLNLMQFAEAEQPALAHWRFSTPRFMCSPVRCLMDSKQSFSRRILDSTTGRWIAQSQRVETSSTSTFARIGPRILSDSASCRMGDWLRREEWRSSRSSMALRRRRPRRWSSRGAR
jgi:hypothetical protein